jgi:transcription antitermination factor NusG
MASQLTAPAWYVIQTAPSAEARVTRRLEAKRFEIYFARTRRLVVHKGIARPMVQPRLPGYLFAHFDPQHDAVEYITEEDGVVRVLGNGEPEPLGVMDTMLLGRWMAYAPDGIWDEVPPPVTGRIGYLVNYEPGQQLFIKRGAYAEMPGTFIQGTPYRVQIEITLFCQKKEVWVDHEFVEGAIPDGEPSAAEAASQAKTRRRQRRSPRVGAYDRAVQGI